jgi:hypothetical protein
MLKRREKIIVQAALEVVPLAAIDCGDKGLNKALFRKQTYIIEI